MPRPFRIPPALIALDAACMLALGCGLFAALDGSSVLPPAAAWTLVLFGGLGFVVVALRFVQLARRAASA